MLAQEGKGLRNLAATIHSGIELAKEEEDQNGDGLSQRFSELKFTTLFELERNINWLCKGALLNYVTLFLAIF